MFFFVSQIDEIVPIPIAMTSTVEEDGSDHDDSEDGSRLWCYCEQPSFGQMITRSVQSYGSILNT